VTASATAGEPIVALDRVSRTYAMDGVHVDALRDVSLAVGQGEFVAIVGPSGSGKSTMMNIVGCLDRPTAGTYRLAGTPVAELSDDGLARLRSRTIGFVFQSYNLLPRTTALDNVATPLLYQGVGRRERVARATAALERLGLGDRLRHEPSQLSGGQQQRVAVARAIVTNPALILADEPTGNLDTASGEDVLALLRELHAAGRTIVLITHDADVAASAPRRLHIRDGRITDGYAAA
jgi:putative ABC transport system ATP-binding protein